MTGASSSSAVGVEEVSLGGLIEAEALPAREQRLRARPRLNLSPLCGGLGGVLVAIDTIVDSNAVKTMLLSPVLVDNVGNVLRIPSQVPELSRPKCSRDRCRNTA